MTGAVSNIDDVGVKLLPCPFCGNAGRISYSDRGEIFSVRCVNWSGSVAPFGDNTPCMGSGAYAYTEDEAIAAWNRRAIPAPAGEVREALTDARQRLQVMVDQFEQGSGQPPHIADSIRRIDAVLSPSPAPIEAEPVTSGWDVLQVLLDAFDVSDVPTHYHSHAPLCDAAAKARGRLTGARAAVSAPQALPDGWVAVPREPTNKMVEATFVTSAEVSRQNRKNIYRAMLSASPPVPPSTGWVWTEAHSRAFYVYTRFGRYDVKGPFDTGVVGPWSWHLLQFGYDVTCRINAVTEQEAKAQAFSDYRDRLGREVREAWIKWAKKQPSPKPSWLVPYDDLSEPDKEADRQIGEALVGAPPVPSTGTEEVRAAVLEALQFYRAEAVAAQTHMGKSNASPLEAILTVLALDGGRRAEAAIRNLSGKQGDGL